LLQIYIELTGQEQFALEKNSEIHTTKFAIAPLNIHTNPYYFNIIAIVWKYTIIMDNQNPFYFQ
jgi:hypothetical protein